ncbi:MULTISPECIES: class I adenylate-forming enzyme family protein [unclassified Microbacterium]|uniref:class I adenylate-forming enzyme family protein n=1 Tax=unclassified Microbacterium TaxID=2609290 RepID=UPI00214B5917|nr:MULTISPECIES: class I adenylate-forming enzyme family protein [unclassified Microbacterium]MCR2811327.1 acyl--CoA ligase [Microbacterium sp. zg.B185]WIM19484.1 class I adenylate-forming enzyme family protein [Microbacterium sp. zg-B185]
MNLSDVISGHARNRPNHPALVMDDTEVTYEELDRLGARVGGWLRARGVRRGERVLFYSHNSIEYLATYLGAARIGAIFAPVHPSFMERELRYVAKNADATIAFVAADLAESFAKFALSIPELPQDVVIVGDGYDGERENFESVRSWASEAGALDLPEDAPLLISYTSGSTSTPKPVLHSHGAETWSGGKYADVWDYRSSDRALIALPLSWAYGISTTTTGLLTAGATIVLLSHFNPVRVLDEIERLSVTLYAGSSTMFVKIMDAYRKRPTNLSSLRRCYVGAEPINRTAVTAFEAVIGTKVWEGYAATEAYPIIVTNPGRDLDAPNGTCGRLVPGAQLRIVDSSGDAAPEGEPGEAQFTCPGRMLEYFREPELTRQRLTDDGWVRSGDLVRRDAQGYYYIVGRLGDMIIRGGANIAPSEIEHALVSVEGVHDATVVSVPDEQNGEAVAAFVSLLDPSVSVDSLRTALASRLASFKIPTHIFFDVDLPHGVNGKKDRRAASDIAHQLVTGAGSVPAT